VAGKRVVVIGAASAVVAVAAFILIAPAFLRPGADRLALVQTPRDYGVTFETVKFRPPDRPIMLRAWWMPSEPAKAAIILVHGGGDDNRSLPYADGLKLAHDLVGHGYAVFSVDLRNYGAVRGACLCGAVQFEVTVPTLGCCHCHCSICRRFSGAGYATFFQVSRERFRLLAGEEHLQERRIG